MNYQQWRAAGSPFNVAVPILGFAKVLRGYGYTVGTIGNLAHLTAKTPEDHDPYSETGWPKPSEYPWVHACDVMPPPAGENLPTLAQLGAQIVNDKLAGFPGIAWLKYINWTTADGHCQHEKWMPDHRVSDSNDVGHIHLSGRTDFTRVSLVYDPVARFRQAAAPSSHPAPHPAAPPFSRTIRLTTPYMHGPDVKAWQRRMRDMRYGISDDSVFGPQSRAILVQFQRDHHLSDDGVLGPISWRAAWA